MYPRLKKTLIVLVGAMFLAGLLTTALAPLKAFAGGKKKIAVFVPAAGHPYFQQKMYGYFDEAEKLGVEVKVFDAGSYANLNKQIAQIEDAVTVGYDGLIVNAVSKDGVNPVIEMAIEKGIALVNEDVLASSPMIKCRTSEDSYNVGRMEAVFLVEKLGGKGKVVLLHGPPGADLFIERSNGTKDYLAKYPEIKVVAEHHLQHDVGLYTKIMDDCLQAFPDMDGVVGYSGSVSALGIANALKAAGKKPGEVVVVNVDLDGDLPELIREGWITGTILCEPVGLARASMRLVKDIMDGKPVPAHYHTKEILITKNTIDAVDRSGDWIPDDWYQTVRQYLK